MKHPLSPILGLLMLMAIGMSTMAEQRGGPNSGGDRSETRAELRNSDNPSCAQQRPCALSGLHYANYPDWGLSPLCFPCQEPKSCALADEVTKGSPQGDTISTHQVPAFRGPKVYV